MDDLLSNGFHEKIMISQQTFVLMKTSSRRLLSSSSEYIRIYSPYSYVFRRCFQDVLIKTNIFVLIIHLQKFFQTFSRGLQGAIKTSCKNVFKTSSRRLQDILKMLSRRLQDVFKASWPRRIYLPYSYVFRRRLQDVLIKTNIFVLIIYLQDIFKMFSRGLQDAFKISCKNVCRTSSRRL